MKKITLYAMLLLVSLSSISSPLFATEKTQEKLSLILEKYLQMLLN